MRNYFYLLLAFTLTPICSFSQMFGGQLKSAKAGTIASINCSTATNNGTLTAGTTASNVSSIVPYTGGNGGRQNGQTVNSTGVTGLIAVLTAGSFANGAGTLTYIITGTPASSGTASFALSIGGQSCTLTRAVANSSSGCGNQSTVTDIDGNVYPVVEIGTQCWMKENLKVNKYRNGDPIPTNLTDAAWIAATTGAYSIYNNDAANNTTYGKLYNWYAVADSRNLCPVGWYVPTDHDWNLLTKYLDPVADTTQCCSNTAGGKMKTTTGWASPNTAATNESGFSGLPGGNRRASSPFLYFGNLGFWWSSTEYSSTSAWYRYLSYNFGYSSREFYNKTGGFSVRCLRDATETGSINNLDCGGAVNTGTLTQGIAETSVSSSVPYTGGNGGTYSAQTITSTGVTGLTATLAAGTLLSGAGGVTYTITGTPATSGTASFALSLGGQTCTLTRTVALPVGIITALSCSTATNSGTLTQGLAAASVSSIVPYTGGNGGTYTAQTITSTGVTGLTATLAAGTLLSGAGSVSYTITGTPASSGTASFALSLGGQTCTLTRTVALPVGTITALSCSTSTNSGTLTQGVAAADVSSSVPYTGGNGGTYSAQTITSTGVTGLTATLAAGTLSSGAGSVTYNITGTPATSGTASFALNIGGQTCTLTRTVAASSTGCGNQSTITDIDGNVYPIVGIGTQCWMKENLKTSKYRNGDLIPTDLADWLAAGTTGAYAIYNNDAANNTTFGKLYNWYAVVDIRNLCPSGWHVPSDTEWKMLEIYLGMTVSDADLPGGGRGTAQNIGGKLRSSSSLWASPNIGATNQSGFSGLPGGFRDLSGSYFDIGFAGGWWSSTERISDASWSRALTSNDGDSRRLILSKHWGQSVRCLRDATETGSINNLDCGGAVNTGTLTQGIAATSVSSSVPYTGGNGGTYSAQTITSTGVTGLTATLAAGTFLSGAGSVSYTITGTPASSGTASFALSLGGQTCTLTRTVALPVGTITALSCSTATNNGTLTQGVSAAGVSSSVPYTSGNGGTYTAQSITSTGVTGLTATLAAGTLLSGAGNLTYTITGNPASAGTASFALSLGGQTCTLTRTVNAPAGNTVTDIDGNTYQTVTIGTQVWMKENLKVSKYRNGDPITTNLSDSAWQYTNSGAYSIYNNDAANNAIYGKLYNWYAVADPRGLCPAGWHVPTDHAWQLLTIYLDPAADTCCINQGGSDIAGTIMRSVGWFGGTNSSGFSGLPGGNRDWVGFFDGIGRLGFWWSSSKWNNNAVPLYSGLGGGGRQPFRFYNAYTAGMSVRCLKD